MAEYNKGKLVFKGDSEKKKKKKKKRILDQADDINLKPSDALRNPVESGTEEDIMQEVRGVGRITSSGNIIFGHDTKFMDQLTIGDAIIVTHPSTLIDETKIVRMVLSNVSIGISSGFSSDLISTTSFR